MYKIKPGRLAREHAAQRARGWAVPGTYMYTLHIYIYIYMHIHVCITCVYIYTHTHI